MIILAELSIDLTPGYQPDNAILSLTTTNNGRIKHSDYSFSTITEAGDYLWDVVMEIDAPFSDIELHIDSVGLGIEIVRNIEDNAKLFGLFYNNETGKFISNSDLVETEPVINKGLAFTSPTFAGYIQEGNNIQITRLLATPVDIVTSTNMLQDLIGDVKSALSLSSHVRDLTERGLYIAEDEKII